MDCIITGTQVRMARAALRWTAQELADYSGVGKSTIRRIEDTDDLPKARTDNIKAVYEAFVSTGKVRFEGETCVCVVGNNQ